MSEYEAINRDLTAQAPGWMVVKPIRTDVDYGETIVAIQQLAGAIEDSPEENLLDVLSTLTAAYEAEQGLKPGI